MKCLKQIGVWVFIGFSLALTPHCIRPYLPSPEEVKYPWNDLLEIDHSSLKVTYSIRIKRMGEDILLVSHNPTNRVLFFYPHSSQNPIENRDSYPNSIHYQLNILSGIDQQANQGLFTVHTYFNDQYQGYTIHPFSEGSWDQIITSNERGRNLLPTDQWYLIFEFIGKDKNTYKYTTPIMSIPKTKHL